eukprot:scaffold1098_cov417-Prasinococcus_capsulatus_cf.AAC.14
MPAAVIVCTMIHGWTTTLHTLRSYKGRVLLRVSLKATPSSQCLCYKSGSFCRRFGCRLPFFPFDSPGIGLGNMLDAGANLACKVHQRILHGRHGIQITLPAFYRHRLRRWRTGNDFQLFLVHLTRIILRPPGLCKRQML